METIWANPSQSVLNFVNRTCQSTRAEERATNMTSRIDVIDENFWGNYCQMIPNARTLVEPLVTHTEKGREIVFKSGCYELFVYLDFSLKHTSIPAKFMLYNSGNLIYTKDSEWLVSDCHYNVWDSISRYLVA